MDKVEVLARVLQAEGRGLTMVFCQTKRAADQVAGALATRGFAVATVHGDLGQGQRERALRAFRSGKVDVLVATEVAARGLDVEDVTHVVNFECPDDDKAYLHRIGRTGRAGREGVAVTFVDWRDMHRWKLIDGALGLAQAEPAETYSTSDHLFTELGIPRSATGTLPKAMRSRAGLDAEDVEDIGETGRLAATGAKGPRSAPARGGRSRRGAAVAPDGRTAADGTGSSDGHDPAHRERSRVRRRTRGGRDARTPDPLGPHEPRDGAGQPAAQPSARSSAHPVAGKYTDGAERGARPRRRRTRGGQTAS